MDEKQSQDKSSTDSKKAYGQDPDRYSAGYGSFREDEYEKKEGSTPTGQTNEANIKEGMNEAEDKSTVSDTSSPSGTVSDKDTDTNSNAS